MSVDRREFMLHTGKLLLLTGAAATAFEHVVAGQPEAASNYQTAMHWWAMTIDIDKCIGCGFCADTCPCGIWQMNPF